MIEALGEYGIWVDSRLLPTEDRRLAWVGGVVEGAGFRALWLAGSVGADSTFPARLLAGTRSLVVGTSVTNIWRDRPADIAALAHRLDGEFGERFLLGAGMGHRSQIGWNRGAYAKPLVALGEYLDALDDAGLPAGRRAVGAIGPRALELAGRRSLGALPFLTTVEHTRAARAVLGPDALLAPVVKVVLEADPDSARAGARRDLEPSLALENYRNALLRAGFAAEDLQDGGSDRLLDALYAWGTTDQVQARLDEHRAAGANHLALHPVALSGSGFALNEVQTLGAVLAA